MNEAAEFSVNTYFLQRAGHRDVRVVKMARRWGVKAAIRSASRRWTSWRVPGDPSFTLGTVEVSPLSMAEAYATVAAGGIHCNPIIISKITSRGGKNLELPDANCRRVMDEDVADGVNKILKSVVDRGTGRRARIGGEGDIAGKTGTINSNEAVWFAGYTPEVAGVAMISIDNTKSPFIKRKKAAGGLLQRRGFAGYRVPSTVSTWRIG